MCPLLMKWALGHRNTITLVDSLREDVQGSCTLARRDTERTGIADPSTAAGPGYRGQYRLPMQ
jgi:hypothetical protein